MKLQVQDLEYRVAPVQGTDTMIIVVVALLVIGAIIVDTTTSGPPQGSRQARGGR